MSTQSTIEGILSQKIVNNGSGYAVTTDIVNVDQITTTGTIVSGEDITTPGTLRSSSLRYYNGTNNTGDLLIAPGTNISLNGNQIINDNGTLSRLGNINMNGKILGDSTGSIKIGNRIDLQGFALKSDAIGTGYGDFVTLESPLNLNGNQITSNTGSVVFGTNVDLNTRMLKNIGNAGTITITGGQTSGTTTTRIQDVTSSSSVIVTPTSNPGAHYWVTTQEGTGDNAGTGTITINIATAPLANTIFNYFITNY